MTTEMLPPLILHPFADAGGPDKLVESSRASLMLQGLLPRESATRRISIARCSKDDSARSACCSTWARIWCAGSSNAWNM